MKPQPEPSTQEVLAGLVERVTFHNAENGFCVLRAKARGHRELVTVIGHAAIISAGEWITATGDWVNDRTHGQQFKARFLRTSAPTSADGIEKYLSSGMIRGVGPAYAKKLVRAFGEKVFDVIEATPDRLREVDGIGPVRAASILAAWAEQKAVREIMVFLHSHGVGTARAVRIFKTYGVDAIQVMTENPYRLARDIRGIGFKTADAIAMKLGIEKTAMVRARAGISYALTEAMDEGHCGLPTEELIPLAETLLEVPQGLIRTALDLELQEGTVVADRVGEIPCVFLAGLHRAERTIADRLMRQANGTLPWPWIDPDKALPWVEERIGLALAESQVAAIRLALMSKVLVMTGGPGVGKTTIVKAILRILSAKGVKLLLCAPTGRAAKRMTEATGFEAKTIHRLLEVDPRSGGFKRGDDNPLDCNMLVVDETSMVDVMLMQALTRAVPDKAALLIVGDIDQLSSVGPGQVLADIISSGAVPVVRLDKIMFQQLATGRWIAEHRNVLVTGKCGVGKSWLSCALAQKACRDGYTVHYARVPRLFAELELAHGDGRFARMFRTLIKADLLILDDWGPDRLTASQRRDLMEIIEDRSGRGSTLITSQLPVEAWHEVIGEPTFADAILDRIVHNAYRLALEGPSMRKPEAAEAEAAVSTSDTSSTATTQTKPPKGARK